MNTVYHKYLRWVNIVFHQQYVHVFLITQNVESNIIRSFSSVAFVPEIVLILYSMFIGIQYTGERGGGKVNCWPRLHTLYIATPLGQ